MDALKSELNMFVANALVGFYTACVSVKDNRRSVSVFEGVPE